MYGAGDVRIEDVPDARIVEPTDALVVVTRAAICGSDLWPYKSMPHDDAGRRMGHEFIGVVDAVGSDVASVKVGAPPEAKTGSTVKSLLVHVQLFNLGHQPSLEFSGFGQHPTSLNRDGGEACSFLEQRQGNSATGEFETGSRPGTVQVLMVVQSI